MSTITFTRRPAAARAFGVLARIDLGHDAANVYDDTLPEPRWAPELLAAYRAAPGRLALHGLPLLASWPEIVLDLRTDPPAPLRDPAGRALAAAFADALDDLGSIPLPFSSPRPELVEPLSRLRAALWERTGDPPPLTLIDVPALGPHARGTTDGSTRVVATSLAEPFEHLLCQIFHEEVHAISDPMVRTGRDHEPHDTASSHPGFALHRELEQAAIDIGRAVIEARAPELTGAYDRWQRRFDR